jgi:predicted GNAT family N-acyltransferase
MRCEILSFGGPEQKNSIQLRREILRTPLGLDFTNEELEQESSQVHIGCYLNTQLAGVLLLKNSADHTLKMRQVAVKNEFQKMGVGKEMVVYAEKWARDNGYKTMELNARKTAVPFYLKLNYSIEGSEFMEVGIPHSKMLKKL